MRPVSDAFLRILRGSHVPIFRATLLDTFQTGVNPVGVDLPVLGGDVKFDAGANVRSTLDLTTTPEWWSDDPGAPLTPYGPEIYVERGVLGGGGQREWVGLGYFRVEAVEQDEVPNGDVRIPGRDRMAGIIDARLEAPRQFSGGASVASVVEDLVLEVYPDAVIEYDFNAGVTTFPGSHICDEDRHEFLDDIVTALAKIWYWDHRGVLVIKDAPTPGAPVWTVNHGPDGVLVAMSRERSRAGIYNSVVATGGEVAGGTPVRAVARDMNPSSPTYWLGKFGKVPRFFNSQFLTTQLGAVSAAQKILTRAIGRPYRIDFSSIANSALEVLDPVMITYSDNARAQVHAMETLTIPLTIDRAMTGSTKDKTDLNIEVVS